MLTRRRSLEIGISSALSGALSGCVDLKQLQPIAGSTGLRVSSISCSTGTRTTVRR